MNKLLLCLLFLFSVLTVSAQKVYFVYIQSETDQPFYLKLGQKTYSSSVSGYLILSKLRDSTYNFTIGFAQNKWPEQSFSVIVNRKDHGYLLRNFGEKGWGLFDLQTLSVQMATSGTASKAGTSVNSGNKDVSVFTDLLSKASDDPSLRDKPVQPKPVEEKKAEVVAQEIIKKEEPAQVKKEPVINKPIEKTVQPVEKKEEPKKEVKDPVVTKSAEVNPPVTENVNTAKTDIKKEEPKKEVKDPVVTKSAEANPPVTGNVNTPKTEIKKEEQKTEVKEPVTTKPVETNQPVIEKGNVVGTEIKKEEPKLKTEEPAQVIVEPYKRSVITKKSESSTTQGFGLVYVDDYGAGKDTINIIIPNPKPLVTATKEQPKEEKKFLDISADPAAKTEEKKSNTNSAVTDTAVVKTIAKDNCQVVANETDFFKLRKSMAAAEGDDEMINEARKYFKTKCFSTAQVKNLGALFLADEGKYKFFDAIYNYTADQVNFGSLQAELKGEYYINRFKAMLRN